MSEPLERIDPRVLAGQAVYTPQSLANYDWFVLGLSNRLVWRCRTEWLLEHYHRHISANHLDVGVGSGYFLDHCRFPVDRPRLALLDLNSHSLQHTARRVARYQPEVYRANVLERIHIDAPGFDSIGMNFLLHCLPGTMKNKAQVFDHLQEFLRPGGVIFGSTILGRGVGKGPLARLLMAIYNRKGIFSNREDDLQGLKSILNGHCVESAVEVVGCVAIFAGRTVG